MFVFLFSHWIQVSWCWSPYCSRPTNYVQVVWHCILKPVCRIPNTASTYFSAPLPSDNLVFLEEPTIFFNMF